MQLQNHIILQFPFGIWTSDKQKPAYGDGWLYFVNENGTNFIMNFTSVSDEQEMHLGDAYFYLYTRHNMDKPEIITVPEGSNVIETLNFNYSNEIKVLTHGWLSSGNVNWIQKIKHSFLHEYDFNVIIVDWSELADNIVYPFAAFSTRYVGKRVAKLLDALMNTYRKTGDSIHLIGHSLGAHIMGYAGLYSNEKIFRITGLDPARPLFEIPAISLDYCLDKSDARFVDIIHSCGGVYGYEQSYGHADFYPNNGKPMQPGCSGVRQVADSCSHGRSHEYFEESIIYKHPKGFVAYPCDNWAKFNDGKCKENATTMGYHTSPENNGDYFLRTRNESKFADNND